MKMTLEQFLSNPIGGIVIAAIIIWVIGMLWFTGPVAIALWLKRKEK